VRALALGGGIAALLIAAAVAAPAGKGGWPRPYSCHVRGSGLYVLPDPRCTPGAIDPAVSQANIASTICRPGWSEAQRPPEALTEQQKQVALAAYGYYDGRALGRYELDHLISLSLGGAPDSPRNLWPEPDYPKIPAGSYYLNPKDRLEDRLHQLVCAHRLSLAAARRIIATNWVSWDRQHIGPTVEPPPEREPRPTCTVSGSYNGRYHDFDVYVRSNQADAPVRVTDAEGDTASYYTDSRGYADVYLHAPPAAAGERVRAVVGGARCSGLL